MDEHRPIAVRIIDPDRYRSYMVRLWREAPDAPWHCQVQCVGTRQEWRFAGLAELFEFLVADTAGKSEANGGNADISDTP